MRHHCLARGKLRLRAFERQLHFELPRERRLQLLLLLRKRALELRHTGHIGSLAVDTARGDQLLDLLRTNDLGKK